MQRCFPSIHIEEKARSVFDRPIEIGSINSKRMNIELCIINHQRSLHFILFERCA